MLTLVAVSLDYEQQFKYMEADLTFTNVKSDTAQLNNI